MATEGTPKFSVNTSDSEPSLSERFRIDPAVHPHQQPLARDDPAD